MSTPKDSGQSAAPGSQIQPATGKLGVMVVGLGAVATTLIAGVEAVRKGLAKPIGSITQMGTIRLGKRTESRTPQIHDFVPLAKLKTWSLPGGTSSKTTSSKRPATPRCSTRTCCADQTLSRDDQTAACCI